MLFSEMLNITHEWTIMRYYTIWKVSIILINLDTAILSRGVGGWVGGWGGGGGGGGGGS